VSVHVISCLLIFLTTESVCPLQWTYH